MFGLISIAMTYTTVPQMFSSHGLITCGITTFHRIIISLIVLTSARIQRHMFFLTYSQENEYPNALKAPSHALMLIITPLPPSIPHRNLFTVLLLGCGGPSGLR